MSDRLGELKKALEKIKNNPKDRIGIIGEYGLYGLGALGGAGVSGTAAAAAGATTILGSTSLGGLLGGVIVATTPVGWIIGTAAVGGLLAYGASRLYKGGNDIDGGIKRTMQKLKEAIEKLEREAVETANTDEKYSKLAAMYLLLIDAKLVDENTAEEILEGIKSGSINLDFAFSNCIKLLDETIKANEV